MRQFKSDLMRKWALAGDQDDVDDTVCEKYDISKEKWVQFCQTRKDPSWEMCGKRHRPSKNRTLPPVLCLVGKLLDEKMKKKLEEVAELGSVDGVIDPPSPVRRHAKWKVACTKKIGEMTTKATKEITEKIDSFEEQVTPGSFVPYGRQDVLTAAIGRPEHPGHVRATRAGVTIKQYFESAPWTSHSSSSIAAAGPANQGPARGVDHKKSQMQSQGLALPLEPLVGPSGPRVSTKESYVDPLENDPETGHLIQHIKANPARLVALGRVYEGSTVVHNTPLLPGQVKVGVEEVKDPDAPVLVPTDEVSLVRQAIHTFLAWLTHLVKSLSHQVLYSYYMFLLFELIHSACLKLGHLTLFHEQPVVSPAKPPQKLDLEVDDPLYLMTLTIPELFLRPYQVTWDATVFGVFNPDFPLYIKHEDFSEITHGGLCLSISVLQLWILHLTETSMRAGNFDIYGFLEPQSIQRFGQSQFKTESYIKS
ncbi:hypothetical protein GmHk_05G012971 [Glycine max]|nr:hypothetical protein GmHk_05G012971 [Glycine max]KAH1249661.1 hypothetical protein GmHk_05G012971 [Glycine max]